MPAEAESLETLESRARDEIRVAGSVQELIGVRARYLGR